MIWWAYAGLSGAVVGSVVLMAWIIGVPQHALMQIATTTASVMLGGAILANIAAIMFRGPKRVRR